MNFNTLLEIVVHALRPGPVSPVRNWMKIKENQLYMA
jgi:hypothetical protein